MDHLPESFYRGTPYNGEKPLYHFVRPHPYPRSYWGAVAVCRNGAANAAFTTNRSLVTCPACIEKIK